MNNKTASTSTPTQTWLRHTQRPRWTSRLGAIPRALEHGDKAVRVPGAESEESLFGFFFMLGRSDICAHQQSRECSQARVATARRARILVKTVHRSRLGRSRRAETHVDSAEIGPDAQCMLSLAFIAVISWASFLSRQLLIATLQAKTWVWEDPKRPATN